ncbi:hypothetical protein E2C01_047348 [Portunus trituberculatus]|uniref:Uncharacterized protein n=1 Tax=Portunus trituberculatus TaxID=210409 RepID=A0A5B7G7H2_PORTR|nr:hypothetical protein [Portunus trituberculatus]
MGVTRLRRSHVCVAAVDCGRQWVQGSPAKPRGKQNLVFGLCRVQFEGPGDCWDSWVEHVTCRPTVAASLTRGPGGDHVQRSRFCFVEGFTGDLCGSHPQAPSARVYRRTAGFTPQLCRAGWVKPVPHITGLHATVSGVW